MTALVAIETILLVLLSLLVAGLLRSHAEILRRLEAIAPEEGGSTVDPSLPPARDHQTKAFDVAGTTLGGDPVKVAVEATGRDTLLAFLSSGCLPCRAFWEGAERVARRGLPGDARLVLVTKDSAYESPSKLRDLAPSGVPVVMSSETWERYGVQGSPYFIHVDGRAGRVRGEGTANEWPQVLSLLRDALADADASRAGMDSTPERLRRADDELRTAGVGPGHPSLYGQGDGPTDA
jgi:hypothetical protein